MGGGEGLDEDSLVTILGTLAHSNNNSFTFILACNIYLCNHTACIYTHILLVGTVSIPKNWCSE